MAQLIGKKKLQSATLLETIVALVIILVIFGIVTAFLAQTGSSSFSLRKLKAIQVLNEYVEETNKNKTFFEEEISTGIGFIRREIIESRPAITVKFSLFDKDYKLITSQQRLFYPGQ